LLILNSNFHLIIVLFAGKILFEFGNTRWGLTDDFEELAYMTSFRVECDKEFSGRCMNTL